MSRHHGAVALSMAPKSSMNSERGQLRGIISTIPYQVHVANLGPRAILAASSCSQLGFGRRDSSRQNSCLGMQSWTPTIAAAVASSGLRRQCHASAVR
jgi:hypothetical protein